MHLGYVNVFVTDISRARAFFSEQLGLQPNATDPEFGYASFSPPADAPANRQGISFALAETDDAKLVGRHTGVGFISTDIEADHARMSAAGVVFTMPPTPQPWGGTLALFCDPDGNVFYLDPGH